MIVPAFDLTAAAVPAGKVEGAGSTGGRLGAQVLASIARASVLGRVRVKVDGALRQDFKSEGAAALIRVSQGGLIVGPFPVGADPAGLDEVERDCVGWLNSGAYAVVLTGAPEACVVLAERLPRHRTYYGIADGVTSARSHLVHLMMMLTENG